MHGSSGNRLLAEKRLDEALVEFKEAARLQPEAARGYLGIGTVLSARAEQEKDPTRRSAVIDEAIRSFEQALVVEPDNASPPMRPTSASTWKTRSDRWMRSPARSRQLLIDGECGRGTRPGDSDEPVRLEPTSSRWSSSSPTSEIPR